MPWLRSVLCLVLCGLPVRAADWPQWLGPQRDGVWREKGILDKFPKDGPKVRWRHELANGYAGPAVANGRVYVMDRAVAKGAKTPTTPSTRTKSPAKSAAAAWMTKTATKSGGRPTPVNTRSPTPTGRGPRR